jgi:hypothetical protein
MEIVFISATDKTIRHRMRGGIAAGGARGYCWFEVLAVASHPLPRRRAGSNLSLTSLQSSEDERKKVRDRGGRARQTREMRALPK